MDSVGIRDFKARLSHHLKRVRSGRRLLVTERGRVIAAVHPVDTAPATDWAHSLVEAGQAQWTGGKPSGALRPGSAKAGRSVSSAIIEDRQ